MIKNAYKKKWFEFVDYKPHSGQLKLHNAPDNKRFIIACCGRRWGKSVASAKEIEALVTQPNKVVWVVAPTYSISEKIFNIVWKDLIIDKKLPTIRKSLKEQFIQFEWGSTFCGKSAEHPDGLVGEGLDLVVFDEASKMNLRRVWGQILRPSLSDKKGKAIFISTPESYNYFWELYLLGKKEPSYFSFNSPTWENNIVFPKGLEDEDLQDAKRTSTKENFAQEYGAEFTSLAGKVYPFDRNLDIGLFPYNPAIPTFCSIDFGYRMPAVLWFQTYQQDGANHVNIIDEVVHQTNLKVDKLAEIVMGKPYNVSRFYGDPAGYQVNAGTGIGDAELFYRYTGKRIFTIRDKTSRNVEAGINHVRSFIENAKNERFLHVNKKCIEIAEDLEAYRYPEHKDGTHIKNEPLKDGYHDHSMDCMRYFFVNKFPIKQYKYRAIGR